MRKSVWHTSNIDATTRPAAVSTAAKDRVMSRSLGKKLEGVFAPFLVIGIEDRKDDALNAGHVYKSDHWSGAAANFYKASLNDVVGC